MATNPKFPEPRDIPPKFRLQPKTRVPWVWVSIIIAAVILLALIIYLPRTPRQEMPANAAQVPPQPTGSQIQFTNLKLAPAPSGGAVYLQGMLVNNGQTSINGVVVDAAFQNANGATLETVRRPVEGLVGGSNATTQPLTEAPIKASEARPVRIAFDHVPEGWNHALPALTVIGVTAVGQPGADKGLPPIVKQQEGAPAGAKKK
jgi:hypothetical protein